MKKKGILRQTLREAERKKEAKRENIYSKQKQMEARRWNDRAVEREQMLLNASDPASSRVLAECFLPLVETARAALSIGTPGQSTVEQAMFLGCATVNQLVIYMGVNL